MTLNLTAAKSIAIYVLGLASVIIGALPAVGVPNSVHAALVAVGGVILAVERYLQGNPAAVAAKAVKK